MNNQHERSAQAILEPDKEALILKIFQDEPESEYCYIDIQNITGYHKNTITYRFTTLADKGLIVKSSESSQPNRTGGYKIFMYRLAKASAMNIIRGPWK